MECNIPCVVDSRTSRADIYKDNTITRRFIDESQLLCHALAVLTLITFGKHVCVRVSIRTSGEIDWKYIFLGLTLTANISCVVLLGIDAYGVAQKLGTKNSIYTLNVSIEKSMKVNIY